MQAHERLINAHKAAQEGRHDFALREFVWFHDNALAENPALYGVRLSFALEGWHELGRSYPPALQELRRVRNAKTALLSAGSGNRDLFDDVAAINMRLGEVNATVALFEELHAKQPHLAVECSSLVRSQLVATGKFELASKYLSNPEAHVRDICRTLWRTLPISMIKPSRRRLLDRPTLTTLQTKLGLYAASYAALES